MVRFVRVFACAALLAAGMWPARCIADSPAPSPSAVSIWCDPQIDSSYATGPADIAALYRAEQALCRGDYAQARDLFAAIVPRWRQQQSNARFWIQTARGYFYSLIATRQDAAARNFLSGLESDNKWQSSKADHLFWAGHPQAAFSAYAAEQGTLDGMPGGDRDKNIDDAAQAGEMTAAIVILQKPSGATGPSVDGSLQLLMLGDAYETLRQWQPAFATWVRAANSGHAVPEFDTLDDWNLSALEMIYYYRAHAPEGART